MPDLDKVARDAAQIFDILYVADGTPRKIMEADKQNSAVEWSEKADGERFDASVDDFLDAYDGAVELLTTKRK